jgi:hypothetical protein
VLLIQAVRNKADPVATIVIASAHQECSLVAYGSVRLRRYYIVLRYIAV